MKTWEEQRARTIADMWFIKNNHPGRYKLGQYEEFENDLYTMFGDKEEVILKLAVGYYNNIGGNDNV